MPGPSYLSTLVRPEHGSQPRARRTNLAQVPALVEQNPEDARGAINGVRDIQERAGASAPSFMVVESDPCKTRRSIDAEKNSPRYRTPSGTQAVLGGTAYPPRDLRFARRPSVSAAGLSRASVRRTQTPGASSPRHTCPRTLSKLPLVRRAVSWWPEPLKSNGRWDREAAQLGQASAEPAPAPPSYCTCTKPRLGGPTAA